MIQIEMEMPKNCLDCPACNEYLMCAIPCNGRGWGENDVKDFSQSRPEWCPMKEQPEIVQCKDCKHGQHIVCATKGEVTIYRVFCTKPYVERGNATHEPDWFCADGERRVQNAK